MGFFKRLFGRKENKQETIEDWEQIVYARDDVDFHEEEQRSRYITNCLEQIADANRELNLLTGEYSLVTTYLCDIEELEALPSGEKEEVERLARTLTTLEKERQRYIGKKDRMTDSEYYQMRKQEDEVEDGIRKLRECEEYSALVKQDLGRLDGERHAYDYRRQELETMLLNLRGMAVIFLTALGVCMLLLLILQFGFEMNTYAGYILAVVAGTIAITALCFKYTDAQRELKRVGLAINRLIQLQNKVKIRYVNNTNLLEYLYIKYDTDSVSKLQKRWDNYQQEKEERKQYAEAEAKTEYYQKQLIAQLSKYRVSDPTRWIHQTAALLDKREMVEIRHGLILRRQALRKQLDYNKEIADTAHKEIMDVVEQYPDYTMEILEMVNKYEGLCH